MSSTAPTLPLSGGESRSAAARPGASAARAFFFILWRDIFVTGRELVPFLAQVVVEPFFMLFVFGKVLTGLGYATRARAMPHQVLPLWAPREASIAPGFYGIDDILQGRDR